MAKMVRSTIAPENIEIDIVKNGSVRILCHWDISEVEIEDEAGARTEYEYAERAIWWALPSPAYVGQDETGRQILTVEGQEYLQSVAEEILGWAQAAGV